MRKPGHVKMKRVPADANGLTEAIRNTILCDGWSSSRINTTGIYVENLYGPGKGGYRFSGSRNGFADLANCICGWFVVIEVKIGNDEQSPDQLEFEREIIRARGIYVIIKTWLEFQLWYADFKSSKNIPDVKDTPAVPA